MTPTELVPHLETCRRLKDAGFPQDTFFSYHAGHPARPPMRSSQIAHSFAIAAPTLEEMFADVPMADLARNYKVIDIISKPDAAEAAAELWLTINEETDEPEHLDAL